MVKDYTIQFSGLADGLHDFNFVLEKPFFLLFEEEVIRDGKVEVDISMDKQSRMLVFRFDIRGVVEVLCDRCSDPLHIAIKGSEQLIAKVSEGGVSDDDEIVFIGEEDFEFDLSQHLFDYVHLMLPMRLTHDESVDGQPCDPEMIRLLDQYSKDTQQDQQWGALEGLTDGENDRKN